MTSDPRDGDPLRAPDESDPVAGVWTVAGTTRLNSEQIAAVRPKLEAAWRAGVYAVEDGPLTWRWESAQATEERIRRARLPVVGHQGCARWWLLWLAVGAAFWAILIALILANRAAPAAPSEGPDASVTVKGYTDVPVLRGAPPRAFEGPLGASSPRSLDSQGVALDATLEESRTTSPAEVNLATGVPGQLGGVPTYAASVPEGSGPTFPIRAPSTGEDNAPGTRSGDPSSGQTPVVGTATSVASQPATETPSDSTSVPALPDTATATVRGIASHMGDSPAAGPRYLALPIGPGHRVRLCGAVACLTLTSTDAGPALFMQRRGRVADLSVELFEMLTGRPASRGLAPVSWKGME